ncbi:MAG TPA: hypothetical protein VK518_04635 [Puia sp.]|nr:hypothetical protein [Puia sp.]
MNKEQLDQLKTDIKYLGFGETNTVLYTELEEKITQGLVGFDLHTEGFFDDDTRMEAQLHFELSKDLTRYIFKKYEATLYYSNQPARTRTQTIYLYQGKGFTFKETFNLLEGRAVNRDRIDLDGLKYNAWCQINFDEKDQRGNYRLREFRKEWHYDLEAALAAYPIEELKNEVLRTNLIRALRRGNIHPVRLLKGRKWEKVFIEACPSSRLLIFRSQATRAAFDYKKEPEAEIPATGLPDVAKIGSRPVEGQDPLPFEVKVPGAPAETEEPEEEEELQSTEGQSRPPAPRSSQRKRIYK